MADNTVTIGLDVVGNASKKIDEISKQIDGLSGTITGKFSKAGELFESAFSIFTASAAVTAGIYAVKKAMDTVFDAENIRAVNNQFTALTKNAGIAGETLREGLVGAADGLIDDTDLIKIANKAIIEMGSSAAKLPQILDLARKATAAFGGSVAQNFEAINQAISSGQTKALKSFGIVIDSDKAYRDYAKSIGIATEVLSVAGKQQAIMNAVIERGTIAFKGVDTSALEAQNSYQRLKVTLGQIGETATLAFEALFGKAVNDGLKATGSAAENLSNVIKANLGTGADQAAAKVANLKTEIKRLEASAAEFEKFKSIGLYDSLTNESNLDRLKKARAELELIEEVSRKQATQKREGTAADKTQNNAADAEAQRRLTVENEKKIRSEEIASQQALTDATHEAELLSDSNFYSQKQALAQEQFNSEIAALDEQRAQNKIDSDQYDRSVIAANEKQSAAILAIKTQEHKKLLADRDSFLSLASSLERAKSKELVAIGKAAALTQIAIDTPKAASGAFAFGSSIGGPLLGAILAGIAVAAETARAAEVVGVQLNSGIDSVPGFGNRDTVPAILTPGERVVPKSTNQDLKGFLADSGGMAEELRGIRATLANLQNSFVVQIGQDVIATEVRRAVESGRVVFA